MNTQTIRLMLAGALGIAVASTSPALAQSTLGGAKTQQNKIGGVAKPAPSVGGAVIHTPSPPTPPKPGAVANTVKPTSPGVTSPGLSSNAALNQPPGPRPNPPVIPPNKGGTVVTSNLKCANGACASKGPKP
ncbi:hypothetical protein [Bradyrhizobium erythrophlei]|jgi:hypothetical protein|uniref:Uncharacterized protein n=1 Tax=Bradyrhizobium erythrophlei TaxID=1437360 RepID=A0A1M7UG45_9BRAD|nr:hypothetical protein [Bradyrhizobium erythrophlei]SHN81958.1 hypothetical protein SAMN05444170_4956 [Bradyrhizobium erythrophlei]